jgi:acetyltransferase-like isoleucine patch superfamily enzyme
LAEIGSSRAKGAFIMFGALKGLFLRRFVFRGDAAAYGRHLGARIGKRTQLLTKPQVLLGSEPYLVTIGDHCEITDGVRFITHDGAVWVLRDKHPEVDVLGQIVIGNNVFIGFNAIVLPGVTIGDNCVVGAGSVVTKSMPPNSVVAGNPARVIRSLAEYEASSLKKSLNTKRMSDEEKRGFLTRHFGI